MPRKKEVQASTIDFLIAAVAINHQRHLLVADKDFQHLAKYSQLKLALMNDQFWQLPAPRISKKALRDAIIAEREDSCAKSGDSLSLL